MGVPPILPAATPAPVVDDQSAVDALLVENPQMNASTFSNLLKAKGFKIVKDPSAMPEGPQKSEADSGSSNVGVLRAQTQESAHTSNGNLNFRAHFTESLSKDDGNGVTRFRVVIIEEGLGNSRDGYYYTKESLQSAVPLFEGKKIYADHPSATEESTRPERSVKDVLGHFESVNLEQGSEGQAILTADVCILPDEPYRWARALMRHSVSYAKKYPDKAFIGLSINAAGSASPMPLEEFNKSVPLPEGAKVKFAKAVEEGLSEVKVVTRLDSAVSCDLVTEAGAGGKVLAMLEQEKKMEKKPEAQKEEDKKEAAPEAPAPGDHADEQQDIALIKKLIAEHLGEEESEDAEVQKHCKQAMEAYEGMGHSKEEAMKCAGQYMKASKHMASKAKEAAPKDEEKPEPKEEAAPTVTGQSPGKHAEAMAAIQGENARLKESLKKFELRDHIEAKCRDSKESRVVTDEFKKLVESAKTKGEVDRLWEAFTKGAQTKRASAATSFTDFVMTEKSVEPTQTKVASFTDCLK